MGGCMGDGQHIWAAAEWLMFVRNLFVREETDTLVIGSGIRPEWLRAGTVKFGPTLTPYGTVSVSFDASDDQVRVQLETAWRGSAPAMELRVPGCSVLRVNAGDERREFLLSLQSSIEQSADIVPPHVP
jgi:hypothetical protein